MDHHDVHHDGHVPDASAAVLSLLWRADVELNRHSTLVQCTIHISCKKTRVFRAKAAAARRQRGPVVVLLEDVEGFDKQVGVPCFVQLAYAASQILPSP